MQATVKHWTCHIMSEVYVSVMINVQTSFQSPLLVEAEAKMDKRLQSRMNNTKRLCMENQLKLFDLVKLFSKP